MEKVSLHLFSINKSIFYSTYCRYLVCNQISTVSADHHRQSVLLFPVFSDGIAEAGPWIEESKRRPNAKAGLLSRYSSVLSLTITSTKLKCWNFCLQSVTLVPNRRRSFTTSFTDVPSYRDGMIDSWEGVYMLREGFSLLKVVEALPRFFIFIFTYSLHMVDGSNFCSQPAIQKWRGCGLRMMGAREIDTHGNPW